jgi:hypothetical protein
VRVCCLGSGDDKQGEHCGRREEVRKVEGWRRHGIRGCMFVVCSEVRGCMSWDVVEMVFEVVYAKTFNVSGRPRYRRKGTRVERNAHTACLGRQV